MCTQNIDMIIITYEPYASSDVDVRYDVFIIFRAYAYFSTLWF